MTGYIVLALIVLFVYAFAMQVGELSTKIFGEPSYKDSGDPKRQYLFDKRCSRTSIITFFFIFANILMLFQIDWGKVYWPYIEGSLKQSSDVSQKKQLTFEISEKQKHIKWLEGMYPAAQRSPKEAQVIHSAKEHLASLQTQRDRLRSVDECEVNGTCPSPMIPLIIIAVMALFLTKMLW